MIQFVLSVMKVRKFQAIMKNSISEALRTFRINHIENSLKETTIRPLVYSMVIFIFPNHLSDLITQIEKL